MAAATLARIARCAAILLLFFAFTTVIAPASMAAEGQIRDHNLLIPELVAAKKRQKRPAGRGLSMPALSPSTAAFRSGVSNLN
jgi:hypothetical protein